MSEMDVIERTKKTICVELRRPALLEVFTPSVKGITYPETYFKATMELITIMLGGSLVITCLFNRGVVFNNVLNDRIGYPNLCVFFDTFPAKYYATICWGFIIYLGCKFGMLDIERTILVRDRLSSLKIVFSIATDVLFMMSVVLFSFVFVIPPVDAAGTQQVWRHSGTFIILIFVIYVTVLANIMEAKNPPLCSFIWVALYGVLAIADVIFICGNFIYYDRNGVGPLFPVWLGFLADYGWFCATPLCTLFLPDAEGVKESKTIVETSELEYGMQDQTVGCCNCDYDDDISDVEDDS